MLLCPPPFIRAQAASGPIAFTYVTVSPQAGGPNYSIPISFGTNVTGKAVMVQLAYGMTANRTLNTFTIGGVTATRFVEQTRTEDASNQRSLCLAGAQGITGTSGNIVLQFSGALSYLFAAVSIMEGHTSFTPTDTGVNAFAAGTGAKSVLMDSLAGGVVWGGASTSSSDFPVFTAGIASSDFENNSAVGGHKLVSANQTNETISINQGPGSAGTYYGVLGAVSFR